jgi:hypothetical protein
MSMRRWAAGLAPAVLPAVLPAKQPAQRHVRQSDAAATRRFELENGRIRSATKRLHVAGKSAVSDGGEAPWQLPAPAFLPPVRFSAIVTGVWFFVQLRIAQMTDDLIQEQRLAATCQQLARQRHLEFNFVCHVGLNFNGVYQNGQCFI